MKGFIKVTPLEFTKDYCDGQPVSGEREWPPVYLQPRYITEMQSTPCGTRFTIIMHDGTKYRVIGTEDDLTLKVEEASL